MAKQPRIGAIVRQARVYPLVCNVCSRLLPKEWFAERPMASARANSRVPQPRHLCIIMLRPPLLPRTPQAAPTTEGERKREKSVPLPTHRRRTLLRVPPPPPSPPPSPSLRTLALSPYPPLVAHLFDKSAERTPPRTRRETVRNRLTRVRTYVRMYGEREKERREYESWTKVGESEKANGERQREDRYGWIVEGAKGLSAPCLPGINHGISDAQPVSTCRSREKHLPRSKSRHYLIIYSDVSIFFRTASCP